MDGNYNKTIVVCCFCGESLSVEEAIILNVQPSVHSNEVQNLFSHRDHFVEKIDKSIFLHPDFFEDEDN